MTGYLINNPSPPGQVTVNSAYDGSNRVVSSSHPYFVTNDSNDDVYEKTFYDGLGRSLGVLHPDNEMARIAYGGNVASLGGLTTQRCPIQTCGILFPVVSLDEAGKQRQEWLDGFGEVVEVDEPSTSTGSPSTATLTISGYEGSHQSCPPPPCRLCEPPPCQTLPDTGAVNVDIGGFMATAFWGCSSTPQSLAQALVNSFNSSLSPVSAILNGTTITLTSIAPAAAISFSVNYTLYGETDDFQVTPASGTLTGGSGGLASSPLVTTYTYNGLGKLTGVVQGAQTRTWAYDGLGRLTQESTPEAGTINLNYVNASGQPCSGNPSSPCSRQAPAPNQTGTATVTTTYIYDTANRLRSKTYLNTASGATVPPGTTSYQYRTSSPGKGQLASMTDPSGSETYTYDGIDRVTKVTKKVGGTTYDVSYKYNAGSQLTEITYPSGRHVYYNYDAVGHLCQVAGAVSTSCNASAAYLTLPSSQYDAAGRPLSATYGNGVLATAAYSPKTFELTSLAYTTSTGSTHPDWNTLFGLNYYYQYDPNNCPAGSSGNNGQIQCILDDSSGTGDSGRSVAYTYDSLGRLLTAKTLGSGSTQYPEWNLSWTYDRYGNRLTEAGTINTAFSPNPLNNQITNPRFVYDAVGNLIAHPLLTGNDSYTYDAEECNTVYTGNGNTATYTCDGNHLRVEKVVNGTTTVSIRSGGQVIAEYDNGATVTSPTREYLYGNNLLATVTGSSGGSGGTIIYQHRDHLSPRIYTDANGNCVGNQGTFPFGELWYSNNDSNCASSTSTPWVFTSYERDAESGNDYALARSYANMQGRFLAPDPLEGHVGDPQSWNRYTYVENDPINLSDPSGQGFWEDLGFAIADIFAIALGQYEILAVTADAQEASEGAEWIGAALAAGEYVISSASHEHGSYGISTRIWACGGGPCSEGGDGSAPQGGGGPGDQGTGSPNNGQGPGGNGTASPGSGSPGPGGGGTWDENSPVPGSRLPNGDVAVSFDFLRNTSRCSTCGNIIRSANDWGNATAVALGVVAGTATGAIAYEEAPAFAQALFGRVGPGPSQINSGLLNSNRWLRIGSSWNDTLEQNEFRISGRAVDWVTGQARNHLLNWPWRGGMPPTGPPSILW